jgi:hypothetical protein
MAEVAMTARDPRIDPQRGDMVRGDGQIRRVMALEGDLVRCESGVYGYRIPACTNIGCGAITGESGAG